MTTTGDIIRSAMRRIQVLAAGEPLPANEGDDGLETLTQMVDGWTNETLLVPVTSVVIFKLLSSISEYTIGIYDGPLPVPENHIETARPEEFITAFIRDGSGTDYIQEIMDAETYARISRKVNTSRPSRFYVRNGWPLKTILFESVPFADEDLHLELIQPLSGILPTSSLTTIVNMPPGYERALIYNLCLELAPEYGKQVSPLIGAQAINSKKEIKKANYRPLVLGMDRAVATQRKGIGTYIIEQGP